MTVMRARDIRDRCKGRVDPTVLYCLEALAEQQIAAADMKRTNLRRMLRNKMPVELYSDPRWLEFWNHPNMKPLFELYLVAGDAPWIPIMNAAIADREA